MTRETPLHLVLFWGGAVSLAEKLSAFYVSARLDTPPVQSRWLELVALWAKNGALSEILDKALS